MKHKTFWILLAIVTLAGWNAATAQWDPPYLDVDETLLTSEAPPADSLHVMAVAVEVRLVALHEKLLASAGGRAAAPGNGGEEGNGNLAPLAKVGGAVVLNSEQGTKLPEMDPRVSALQAPVRLTLRSGVEGEIAEFGGPSGELRLRPTVSDDRRSVHVELSYRYPGHPGSVTSIKENIPSGSVLAVSVGERVSTGRSENKTPILEDVP